LLINFGATSLEYKKVFHNRLSEVYRKGISANNSDNSIIQ